MCKTFIQPFVAAMCCLPAVGWAQQAAQPPDSSTTGRSIHAIGYVVGGGSTTVDLKNTGLMPRVSGEARVESKPGVTTVEVQLQGLRPPTELGAEFLSCVLWAVSPEG